MHRHLDVWSAVKWWDAWQLRVLVLGSLGVQWFLLVAAPMRQFAVPRCFRTFIWLAYISCDAVAIYALATLFNRHARTSGGNNDVVVGKGDPLEILWAPVLLIHLGGQQELTAYNIEDNELWTRHTVTVVSQVTVALYAFYKSWPPNGDSRLLASAILLFIIGVLSFSEKPWALWSASIYRLASVASRLQGYKDGVHKKRRSVMRRIWEFCTKDLESERGSIFEPCLFSRTEEKKKEEETKVFLMEREKVHLILSDMSLLAVHHELKYRNKEEMAEQVLYVAADMQRLMVHWLRKAFRLIYTRANVVWTPLYLAYHTLVVPALHMAAIALFVVSHKRGHYNPTDVKITYVVLCFTAGLNVIAVFIRLIMYQIMSKAKVPALCETIPQDSNVLDLALRRCDPDTGWCFRKATRVGYKRGYLSCNIDRTNLHQKVAGYISIELAIAKNCDFGTYRSFQGHNWILSKEDQEACGPEKKIIRRSFNNSFDRSVLLWHIATDLCLWRDVEMTQAEETDPYDECTMAISNYMAHLLNSRPDMLMTGSRRYLFVEAMEGFQDIITRYKQEQKAQVPKLIGRRLFYKEKEEEEEEEDDDDDDDDNDDDDEDVEIAREEDTKLVRQIPIESATKQFWDTVPEKSCIHDGYKLARKLRQLQPDRRRELMYHVWVGMLCYSATMCRGYLHAKSLGEGGEFLSYIWLAFSLKGAMTLSDKLQMSHDVVRSLKESSADESTKSANHGLEGILKMHQPPTESGSQIPKLPFQMK